MRNRIITGMVLALVVAFLNTACSSDDEGTTQSNQQVIADLQNNANEGTWRVSNYNDSGTNETSDFAGFEFTFGDAGVLTATNGTRTLTGTWSVTNDSNSSDDDGSDDNDVDFNIFFSVADDDDFDDLVDDWDLLSYSDTEIRLRDVSGGDGSVDLLTFTKL